MAQLELSDVVEEDFATAPDGTKIYYEIRGNGPETILIADGFGCDGFIWKYFHHYFGGHFQTILVKYRGHGRSEKPYDLHNLTMEHLADDVKAVADHQHLDKPILAAYSMGVQVALEYLHRYPDSVKALLFVNGNYQYPIDTFHDTPTLKNAFPLLFHMATRYTAFVAPILKIAVKFPVLREVARQTECNPALIRPEDLAPYFDHLASMDVDLAVRLMNFASSHSAEPYLPEVKIPTLIVAGERDAFTPMWVSRIMNERIAGSELFVVRGGTHSGFLEQPLMINLRIEEFLKKYGFLDASIQLALEVFMNRSETDSAVN